MATSPQRSAIQIGNEALARLGLPSAEVVSQVEKVQRAYAILGQILDGLNAGKLPNAYLARNVPAAVDDIRALSDKPIPTISPGATSVDAWLEWLRDARDVRSGFATIQGQIDAAPSILKFLAALAKLNDARAILDVKDAKIMDLSVARAAAPKLSNGCKSVYMLFFLPQRSDASASFARPLLVTQLLPETSQAFGGLYGPNAETRLVPSVIDLFHSSGEPLGDYSEVTLAEVLGAAFSGTALTSWQGFFAEIDARCETLFGGSLHEVTSLLFGKHAPAIKVMVVDAAKVQAKRWSAIYENLLNGTTVSTTVNTAVLGVQSPVPVRLANSVRSKFLGHMDTRAQNGAAREAYPLDPTQRLAAMQASLIEPEPGRCILPVNGPPGTGKTSFLRAVLASSWVAAALAKSAHPPIIYGTGATNKAVSNVIDAFDSVPESPGGELTLTMRWLDGLPSYGWFFPSRKGKDDYPDMMHLVRPSNGRSALSPGGGAMAFAELPWAVQQATYLMRASSVLQIPESSRATVEVVVADLHGRIRGLAGEMQTEQAQFAAGLDTFGKTWRAALATAVPTRDTQMGMRLMQAQVVQVNRSMQALEQAVSSGALYYREAQELLTGWRSLVPRALAGFFFGKRLADLDALEVAASDYFDHAGLRWTTVLPSLGVILSSIRDRLASLNDSVGKLNEHIATDQQRLLGLNQRRKDRREAWGRLNSLMRVMNHIHAWEQTSIRYARTFAVHDGERQMHAHDMLWARLDERQDLAYRIRLFHLAARYWEGRWLQTQADEVVSKVTDETTLQKLMMLGVIVVATTDKLCDLGARSACDVLIMDESGQCAPEVAVGALSFARTAILVGDTKQLQPISRLPELLVKDLAKQSGLEVNELVQAFSPNGGSAMAIAQRAAAVFDRGEDNGITLLYHYRCHPAIIGYCNELMYGGRMRFVRAQKPTPAGLPPLAWVDVGGVGPSRQGTSWRNEGELEEISRWILDSHERLCSAYQLPLDKVLAVITPLASQARLAREYLLKRVGSVLGERVINDMTIGTVHSLQGAEKPVVAFSLVQQRQYNPSLFADRDGGFLMNVAVSRAKDSFVVFADRRTLQGAKADACSAVNDGQPISRLGAYMRANGTRLYPRALVIVEAPGKVAAIKNALGLSAAVIATEGSLRQVTLGDDGGLAWTPSPQKFMGKLLAERGMLDAVYVATDDDLAGELIGVHAAEDCTVALGGVVVKRMRFHAVTPQDLQLAWRVAGPRFDADLLAAALVREYARLWDERQYRKLNSNREYVGMAKRDLVASVDAINTASPGWTVHATLSDASGATFQAFVPESRSALAAPKRLSQEAAMELALDNEPHGVDLISRADAVQKPPLYPASTTVRILALAADQLGMVPWDTQEHLNALYQEGANP
jgi:hypothetical protein